MIIQYKVGDGMIRYNMWLSTPRWSDGVGFYTERDKQRTIREAIRMTKEGGL